MDNKDKDFFGIEEIIRSTNNQLKITENTKSSHFFDSAFFPGLVEEENLKNMETEKTNDIPNQDFFETNFNLTS